VLGPGWTELVALAAAYVIAVLATPAGISGAVLLLPFQVSVLGTPSPAVTPTNLLYNIVATPGGLYRYWRQHQTGGRLALVLIGGTVPGVIAGSVIRVELLPSASVFALAVAVGCAGGIYGIGGGSILAPILAGTGRKPAEVAPAALASTFVTSVAGVITFTILAIHAHVPAAPDWPTGIALGIGGLAGAYTGARVQSRLPELLIRRVMAVLVVAIGVRYLIAGLL
jgi:hypothetical protein